METLAIEISNLKSNSDLIIEKIADNEINLVGIANMDQYEFIVSINLRSINGAEHFGEQIHFGYTLFELHQSAHTKNTNDEQFLIEKQLTIKIKCAYNDLITYFRNNFTIPINVTRIEDDEHILGRYFFSPIPDESFKFYYFFFKRFYISCHCCCSFCVGSAQISFSESFSTLPASFDEFRQVFRAQDCTYSFDNYSNLSNCASGEKKPIIQYSFQLKLISYTDSDSPANSMLPLTMLQSSDFNKYKSTLKDIISGNGIDDKPADNEIAPHDQELVMPRTFAYTLTLLDCSFNKRPFTGIWQLRYVTFWILHMFFSALWMCREKDHFREEDLS